MNISLQQPGLLLDFLRRAAGLEWSGFLVSPLLSCCFRGYDWSMWGWVPGRNVSCRFRGNPDGRLLIVHTVLNISLVLHGLVRHCIALANQH